MATRSTVKFYEGNDNQPLVAVYHQWDGYITGVGHDLANWLKGKKIINGIRNETMFEGYANGMDCLAAQYIAEHKTRIGSLYITQLDNEEEFNYKVRFVNGQFEIEVDDFKGTPDELLKIKR